MDMEMMMQLFAYALGIVLAASMLFVGYVKAEYPLAYYDIIKNEAINNSLDPVLVFAVVKAESDFNETAVSNKGAVGLMQLLPRTAESIAESFGFGRTYCGRNQGDCYEKRSSD